MDVVGDIVNFQLKLEAFVSVQYFAQLIPGKHLAVDNNLMYPVIHFTIFKSAHNFIIPGLPLL